MMNRLLKSTCHQARNITLSEKEWGAEKIRMIKKNGDKIGLTWLVTRGSGCCKCLAVLAGQLTLSINISFSSFQLDEEFPVIFWRRVAGEPRQR